MASQMQHPHKFPGVVIVGMAIVVAIGVTFALGGYMLFGASIQVWFRSFIFGFYIFKDKNPL